MIMMLLITGLVVGAVAGYVIARVFDKKKVD